MSVAPAMHAGDVAPHALHNSGPCPREVYRTPAVGRSYRLDLRMLSGSESLPAALRRMVGIVDRDADGSPARHVTPPTDVHAIARTLLASLDSDAAAPARVRWRAPKPATADEACTMIARLAERVAELGWLQPFHGLATVVPFDSSRPTRAPTEYNTEWPWLPGGTAYGTLRMAWNLCAISYLSPPLILWTREPSLAWWRSDVVIELQWFGESAPEPATHAMRGGRR